MSDEIPADYKLYKPGDPVPSGWTKTLHEASGNIYLRPTGTPSIEQQAKMPWYARTGLWLAEKGLPSVGTLAKKAALPTLGAVGAGAATGFLTGGPAGGMAGALAVPAATFLGSLGGEVANQLTGIETQPMTGTNLALTGAASLLPGGLKLASREIPGMEPSLQLMAQTKAAEIAQGVKPRIAAGALFEQLPRDVTVPIRNFAQATGNLSEQLGATAPAGRLGGLKRLETIGTQTIDAFAAKGIPPDVFDRTQRLLGTYAREAKVSDVRQAGGALRDALLQDLEDAATKQGSKQAELYRQAANAYKSELAYDRINEYLSRGPRGAQRSAQGNWQTNYDAVANKIASDPDITRWLGSDQIERLTTAFQQLARNTPRIPSSLGAGISNQSFAQRQLGGFGLGYALFPRNPVMGGMTAVVATEALARAISSPLGQAVVAGLASRKVPTEQIVQLLAQMGAASTR